MSCTVIPDPLRDLLATVAADSGKPMDQLDPEQYDGRRRLQVRSGGLCSADSVVGASGYLR